MKEIHSWTPREPSERIARRLFGKAEAAAGKSRRRELWGWLTPAAACGLTMLLAVGGMNRRAESLEVKGDPTFFAAVMLNPAWSNTQQMVRLSQMDENVQWNVWPKLIPPGPASSLREVQGAAATNLIR
ncbi:MAG: hypothetical protein ABSF38_14750 [Verrucomicrobiota bacterium]|jgi:hypothetical protein